MCNTQKNIFFTSEVKYLEMRTRVPKGGEIDLRFFSLKPRFINLSAHVNLLGKKHVTKAKLIWGYILNYCFQYMIILLLVFIVQLSVSCACLALNKEQQVRNVSWLLS